VKVIAISEDDTKALVKHPGGMVGQQYISSWVDLVRLCELGFVEQRQVWDCARDKDGPLTKRRAIALATKYLDAPEKEEAKCE